VSDRKSFVFYEPSGRRRWWFQLVALTVGAVVGLALLSTLLSVSVTPRLPRLQLPPVANSTPAPPARLPGNGEARAHVSVARGGDSAASRDGLRDSGRTVETPGPGHTPFVFGYYVNWDPASVVSLRRNLRNITHLVPEWLTLANAAGDLKDSSNPDVIRTAAEANVPILAMVTNFRGGWQADDLHRLLNDPAARANLVHNIYDTLLERGFVGVHIDLERLAVRDREQMTRFMRELRAKLETAGLLVTQAVPVADPAYDLSALARINDYLAVMLYDEHWQGGPRGAVASKPWFARRLAEVGRRLPRDKTIIGVGNYGYDWRLGARGARPVGFPEVMAVARSHAAGMQWDDATGNPVLRYQDGATRHEVWFLDAVTMLNQLQAIAREGMRGVGLWRLGAEDPGVWSVLTPKSWPAVDYDPEPLTVLSAETTVRQRGQGEILVVAEKPKAGRRRVWRGPGGDFAEQYERYPAYYALENRGRTPEPLVALTFDDGPDPGFTPRILDILKTRRIPATFFVVGQNVAAFPALLKRAYAEGHEIGNHTFSHPNLAGASTARVAFELNATQRIIQHTLGVSTLLFRPPYQTDSEPQTPEEIEPLLRAKRLGYLTIGARIDPNDWTPEVSPQTIVTEVLTEQQKGQVVLLHDGGGDRTATVDALPQLIDELSAQGYRFVRVSELLGRTRVDVMPPAHSRPELELAGIAGEVFGVGSSIQRWGVLLFVATIGLVVGRTLLFAALAVWQKLQVRRRRLEPSPGLAVSVIIPAHNEEPVIARTVRSVLDSVGIDLEVLIIDDGSTDGTLGLLRRTFGNDPRVRILAQGKSGKAVALNRAIAMATHEILVTFDADTVPRADAIAKLARHFADPRVGAVSGNVRVGNRAGWLARLQSIEYIGAFNIERRALDLLNAITVVPGAVGAWRKESLRAAGGFSEDTLAEDTDLTLAIRRLGYRIRYDEQAVAFTEVPEGTRALAKQRFRWLYGTLQAAWKHRDALCRPRYGLLGWVALPNIWLFQLFLPVVAPFAELAMLVALCTGNWPVVLLYSSGFFALELGAGLLAYALEGERPSELLLLVVQRVYYRYLLLYLTGKSLLCAIKGGWVEWTKLERRLAARRAPRPVDQWSASPPGR
jgi:cellulose synthase/poly-beta-1,6-N-acetylglucosamine synthase-like glycosyltransferase/spore germination protein YaaH/peptidoglycan/xylan/chitin deacetylase (PgdA/CDA1 family)